MSIWVLVQVLLNLIFLAGMGAAWIRLKKPAPEDPRMSKGLQLLQSKIAVLEDLSDRTDVQVKQLNALLETKCVEIQSKINDAEKILRQIETSRQKSQEVAKIFEDKIPHQQIVERQNTIKYVKAARLAHQGVSIQEILKQVDLSQAEVEFIAKVNRGQLMFSEENLPAWIQDQIEGAAPVMSMKPTIEEPIIEIPVPTPANQDTLKKLGEQFQKAMEMAEKTKALSVNPQADYQMTQQTFVEIEVPQTPAEPKSLGLESATQMAFNTQGKSVQVRPFAFPRIEKNS